MRQRHLGKVDAFALAAEFEQRHEPAKEQTALFDGGGAVVEHLGEETVHALVGADVVLEEEQRSHVVPGGLGALLVIPGDGLEPALLRGLVALQQAVGDRLDRRDKIALFRLGGPSGAPARCPGRR